MASVVEDEGFQSTMTVAKAMALIQNKHSSKMLQRHQRALNRLAQRYKRGYLLRDLEQICQLLVLVKERLSECQEYEEPLRKLIAIFRMPFLKERASDENTYSTQVIEVLSLLGKISVSISSESVRYEIAKSLGAFYEGRTEEDRDIPEELQVTNKSYNMVLVERSGLASSLIQSLQVSTDIDTQMALLETLLILSHSSVNCNHMLAMRGAALVCNEYLLSGEERIGFIAVEVLWNLLENGSQLQVSEQISSFKSIQVLQKLFKDLMFSSTSQQRRQLRNDVLMIISLLASNSTNAPFVETQFLKDLCEYATFSEEEYSVNSSLRHLKLTYSEEDFELKKGLMCLLVTLSTLPAAIKVISSQKVIRSLLSYVITNDSVSSNSSRWTPAQFEELQLLALSCLSHFSPLCIEDYMTCQGNTRLLLLIEWCTKQSSFGGHGNSFHGTGGRNTKYSQLRYSLQLLMSMCSTGDEWILQDLHEQGIIPLLIGLLKDMQGTAGYYSNPILLEIQSDSLTILSFLCDNNIHRKELFGGYDGVPLLIEYLRQDTKEITSELGRHQLLFMTTTDCIWSTVIGHSAVEDIFLEEGGVFALLDLLLMSPVKIKRLVLGVLVDLCENPKAVPHVTAWQMKGGNNCWSLLAQLWRQEEKDMGLPREDKGTLVGTTLPLMGATQNAQGMPPLPTDHMTAAIEDISENMRAKIYAMCTKIGFGYPSDGVTTEDKITLCIVENYLDFKTGEVWYEVGSELAQEGLRPTSPDQECLQEIIHCSEERAEEVTRQQHELIDEQHRQDLDDEYQFYEQLRDAQISSERAQEKEEKLILRTSNYKQLQEAKERQLNAIDASRPSAVSLGERFHSTNHSSLNVTAFSGRHVSIATTPMKFFANSKMTATTAAPAATTMS